jgi:valyl-tRNA synthetase
MSNAESLLDVVCEVLATVRRTKTEAKVSQRAAVEHVLVNAMDEHRVLIESAMDDLLNAGAIAALEFGSAQGERPVTTVRLAPPEQSA